MKGEREKFAIMVGDKSMPLSVTDRPSSKKTNKAINSLKNTINQWNLRAIKHLTRA